MLILLLTIGLSSANAAPADNGSTLSVLVESGHLSDLRWPDFSDYTTRVQSFYEPSGYSFAWTRGGTATAQAAAIIEVLKAADSQGLNPEDYDGSRWADHLAGLQRAGQSPPDSALARFDLALTVSVMRYISDVHLGRVNPGLFHAKFDLGDSKDDLPGFVRKRLVDAADVNEALAGIEPPYEGYRRTKVALQKYIVLARDPQSDLLPVTKKPVEPRSPYAAAEQLAGVLRRLGDLPGDAKLSPGVYDGPLVDALKHFQTRHGLDPDGRLGKGTIAQLNTPLSFRVRQLQLTLERWRWVPHSYSRPPIVVNIPEFQLRALSESYLTELDMKVVVGKAYHHQTPVFAAEMRYVIFRPYWNVPRSIQRAELVPKLDRDRSYLAKNGYEVVTPQDQVVTNGIVDDDVMAQLRSGRLWIRQTPGPKNSLGLVKFLFPNEHDVYLHDTPATELFARSRRDFSHGCIRVERPEQLASWVLRDKPEWTPERIHDAMHGNETIQVTLDTPIPVLIVYATAVVLDHGEVRFFDDIYGQDAQIDQLFSKGYPCPAWKPTSDGPGPHPHE